MTEEVEVNPSVGAPALRAAEHAAVEAPRLVEVADMEGKMKDGHVTFCVESFIVHKPGVDGEGVVDNPCRCHHCAAPAA